MKKLLKFCVVILVIGLSLESCDKDNVQDEGFSDTEIAQLEQDISAISLTISEILANPPIDTTLVMVLLEEYRQLESVENAWLDVDGIVVKVKNGGLITWSYKQKFVMPPFFNLNKIRQMTTNLRASNVNKILPENNKVGIFCTLGDADFEKDAKRVLHSIEDILNENGFDADPFFDDDFTMNNLMSEFPKYSTVIVLSHGTLINDGNNGKLMAFYIGEKFEYNWIRQIIGENKELYKDWKEKKIIIDYFGDFKPTICVTQKFFDSYFADGSLSNTLAFFMSCHAMENDMSIGKIMEKKRKNKGVTIGYDNSNNIAPYTGWYLFNALLNGNTVGESFENFMPYECLHNIFTDNGKEINAELVYYPNEGKNVAIIGELPQGSIEFISPQNGKTYSDINDRTLTLRGICHGFGKNISGTVSVNSTNYTLTFINDSIFEQPIEINQGTNIIKVTCLSSEKDNYVSRPITASSEITVIGNFPRMALYTAMRWDTDNTDVDLHLIGPNNEDCYYYRMQTSWGGFLDVDNVLGRGPEHITIPELKLAGTYRLFVHYYAARGNGASNVWVNVSTTSEDKQFGPYTLNNTGDRWEVCNIEYPSGAIITTNLRSSSILESVQQQLLNLPKK